ncbi:MAG: hypothetical protein LUE98_03805 [Tannerellaceae bacterium]|nr:hypothetical protein [Tannerellaceae bacterium]
MITIGIILTTLTGYLFVHILSTQLNICEKTGLSFLSGIAIQSFGMLLLDMVNIPLTLATVLTIQSVTLLLCAGIIYKTGKTKQLFIIPELKPEGWRSINLIWVLFIIGIVYVEYMNFMKCIYFPVFDRDSLAGFETIGYVTAQEHTLKSNILYNGGYNIGIHNPGSYISYTPMVMLSYAYIYLLGAVNSKLVNALIYLFFLIAFYGCSKRFTNKTGAAITTFFVLLAPEMLAFSSLSATNVIHACYAAPGVLYGILWLTKRKKEYMYLSAFLLAANVWSRTEGIVFIAAIGIISGIYAFRRKNWKEVIFFGCLCILPVIVWILFTKLYGLHAEGIAIIRPFWDTEKAFTILNYFLNLFMNINYYGYTFYLIPVGIILNGWFMLKKKDNLVLLSAIFLSLIFYILILYQIDYKWDTMENVLSYSAKRFLFCFVPLVWIWFTGNRICKSGLEKLESFLSLKTV